MSDKNGLGEITEEEAGHLHNIGYGGLMKKVTPSEFEDKFVEQGYVRRATGGLMLTETGHNTLMMWKKVSGK